MAARRSAQGASTATRNGSRGIKGHAYEFGFDIRTVLLGLLLGLLARKPLQNVTGSAIRFPAPPLAKPPYAGGFAFSATTRPPRAWWVEGFTKRSAIAKPSAPRGARETHSRRDIWARTCSIAEALKVRADAWGRSPRDLT